MRVARRILGVAVLAAVFAAPASAADDSPRLVPALREWSGNDGRFVLGSRARVVADRSLLREARTLAADLGPRVGVAVRRPRSGDVVLRRRADPSLGDEGYTLRIVNTATISAPTAVGAFNAGRTLLQLLKDRRGAPRGRGRDWPRYPERGLMVDIGRKYFTPAWLEARVKELTGLKLNLLHLHFSDNEGFRVQSESHPEVVSPPALSKAELKNVIATATRHHVEVVPEIDAPGHLRQALSKHPELQLANVAGQKQPDKLDVTLPEARRFIGELVDEYAALFPGRWWHTGADEYLGIASTEADYEQYPQLAAYAKAKHGPSANGKDAVLDFVNEIGARVRAKGKELRVWSDGIKGGSAVQLDRRTAVEWWENRSSPTPAELVAQGHRVLNAGWWPTYFVTGGPLMSLRAPVREMYEDWEPHRFEGPYNQRWFGGRPDPLLLDQAEPRQLGATVNVWNDVPNEMTEQQIADGIAPRLRVLAQKTWGSPAPRTYAEFEQR